MALSSDMCAPQLIPTALRTVTGDRVRGESARQASRCFVSTLARLRHPSAFGASRSRPVSNTCAAMPSDSVSGGGRRAQRVLVTALLALSASCGGGSSPTGPPAIPTPPAPTPSPPPEPGFVLVRAERIDWPADPIPQIGFEFSVPTSGDVLVELVDAVVASQTTSTHITLSLHTEEALGGAPQCVQFQTRCTGIAEDEVIVPLGGPVRRLAATATVATAGPYFAMVGNWGPTGTIQGSLNAWFRATAP